MHLFLLRHGRSKANIQGLVTGDRHDTLTQEGILQAQKAASLIEMHKLAFSHYFVSDWTRAQETASLFCPGVPFTVDARLGETDAGKAAEMPLIEFNQRYPTFWSDFSPEQKYPCGESHQDLYNRVLEWLHEIEERLPDDANILGVTHAGPICTMLHFICRVKMRHFPMFIAQNASITHVCRDKRNGWRLVSFSETSGSNIAQ